MAQVNNNITAPILVTGAGGRVGGVSTIIVEMLRKKNIPVRAMVRREDERAEALRKMGAEVIVGDLCEMADVHRAMEGVKRVYYSMPVTACYLEASLLTIAMAKHHNIECFVNMSQLTVSQMTFENSMPSPQARAHWLAEQALQWSGVPFVNIRPTIFLENPLFHSWAKSAIRTRNELRIPLAESTRINPIAAHDVARACACVLVSPASHLRKSYNLTGRTLQSMQDIAVEYSMGLGKEIKYVPVEMGEWKKAMDKMIEEGKVEKYVVDHLHALAGLLQTRGRQVETRDLEELTGEPAMTVAQWAKMHLKEFS